jgi:hypothetical protein
MIIKIKEIRQLTKEILEALEKERSAGEVDEKHQKKETSKTT